MRRTAGLFLIAMLVTMAGGACQDGGPAVRSPAGAASTATGGEARRMQSGPPLYYTALGDSVATGYVDRFAEYLGADRRVDVIVTNLAEGGWTSGDLVDALRRETRFRTAITLSRLVTWDIGGNDFDLARAQFKDLDCGGADNQDCLREATRTFKQNWDGILAELNYLTSTTRVTLLTVDIYNPYVSLDHLAYSWGRDGDGSDFEVLQKYLNDWNAYIAATAARFNVGVAGAFRAFNGPAGNRDPATAGYLAEDREHPSEAGHQVIAGLLRELVRDTGR